MAAAMPRFFWLNRKVSWYWFIALKYKDVIEICCIPPPHKTLFCLSIKDPFRLFEKAKVIAVAKDKRQTAFCSWPFHLGNTFSGLT